MGTRSRPEIRRRARLAAAVCLLPVLAPSAGAQTLQAVISEPDSLGFYFGRSVAVGDLNGDGRPDIVVSSNNATVGEIRRAGIVYVFTGTDEAAFEPAYTLTAPVAEAGEFGRYLFVTQVDGDGVDDLVVPSFRAPGEPADTYPRSGKVYVYPGGAAFGTPAHVLARPEPEYAAQFGATADVGDLDGDGLQDIVAGAHLSDVDTLHDAGKAFVFLGRDGFAREAALSLIEPSPETYPPLPWPEIYRPSYGAEFGRDVAVGDLNGDGFDDVLAGTAFASADGKPWAGRVQVYFGGAPFDTTADLTLFEPEPEELRRFGWILATGDVNGDGYTDVVASAPGPDDTMRMSEGRLQVFLGGPQFDAVADHTLYEPEPQPGAQLGRDDIAIGDLDGDGFDDVIVGAPLADVSGVVDQGRVQVFSGGPALDAQADHTLLAPEAVTGFGVSMALSARHRLLAVGSAGRKVFVYAAAVGTSISAPETTYGQDAFANVYPNPTSGSAVFPIRLAAPGRIRLAVFNALGQQVGVVADGTFPEGAHRIQWAFGDSLPAGVYFCRLQTGSTLQTRVLVVAGA